MTWYKDDEEIIPASIVSGNSRNFTILGNGMQLLIQPITIKAEGTYKCVAENDEGKAEKSGFLTIQCKDFFYF